MKNSFRSSHQFGATRLSDGSIRFGFWAPAQESVSVAIAGGGLLPMRRSADGWFDAVAPIRGDIQYQYRLSDGTMVPDPASHGQATDVHGFSVVQGTPYSWRNANWLGRPWTEVVLYEIHVGIAGGFRGVCSELPRLKELGVTAIELMPVNDFSGQRNWGYDGVLPFAPASPYGTPDDLKTLVDTAHGLGLMVFLDVVYNHFGPDGNYLSLYAPQFFRDDVKTPWGPAIDFRRQEVRDFFIQNVMMWLSEFRFDGLRFDAVHAIHEQGWVEEMTSYVRSTIDPSRYVHLVLEHHNAASHLRQGVNAQWNDDGHNVLHVLLTGEDAGYYADYVTNPAGRLALMLAEGWIYQGQWSGYLNDRRGEKGADLPPYAHVLFLQNHDQVGNRAFGERLTTLTPAAALEAAITMQMLCPQIPLLFMGEEVGSRTPFLFFTDYRNELADAVREGRRQEFAGFSAFADETIRENIPDPNAPETFQASRPDGWSADRFALYQRLISIRKTEIVPRLPGTIAVSAEAIGSKAVRARWRLGDGSHLTVITNLGTEALSTESSKGRLLFQSGVQSPMTAVFLEASLS